MVGGQAVNAYAEPVVSLDLVLAVAAKHAEPLESLLAASFRVEQFPDSLNVSLPGPDLRVQFRTDPRYAGFVAQAEPGDVLGRCCRWRPWRMSRQGVGRPRRGAPAKQEAEGPGRHRPPHRGAPDLRAHVAAEVASRLL